MNDEPQVPEETPVRELDREHRRLARLRRVVELHVGREEPNHDDDFDPEPNEAA